MISQRKENSIRVEEGPFLFQATRRDPYGLWFVEGRHEKKKITFDSEYTSPHEVMQAIQNKITALTTPKPNAA